MGRSILRMLRHSVEMLETAEPGCSTTKGSWAASVHGVADGQGMGHGEQGVSLVLDKGKIGSEAIVLDWIQQLGKPEPEPEPAAPEEPAGPELSDEELAQQ